MPPYTIVSSLNNAHTCGHNHRQRGRALDCIDRLSDAALFCKHHTFKGDHCEKCGGPAIPKDTSGTWDKCILMLVEKP